jgi:peroxiredoxin
MAKARPGRGDAGACSATDRRARPPKWVPQELASRLTLASAQTYNHKVATGVVPEVRDTFSVKGWRRFLFLAALSFAFACSTVHGLERLQPWPDRATLPFSLESLDGHTVALAHYRDVPVLIHYFATSCIPCRRELPALAALASRFPTPQLKILAISVAEPDVRVRRFFEALPVPFPVLLDRQRAAARGWGVDVLPTTVLLDARGKPRLFVEGEFDWGSEAAADAVRSLAIPIGNQQSPTPVQEDTP